ncbi:MAG: nitrate reductase molybdenum cofactor assembly chaperone [Desulfobacteraceae bacterium]|nr:nitrate reductase molybdenum cofactor assembly chaperone [Desulfobacteraceae bacterium]
MDTGFQKQIKALSFLLQFPDAQTLESMRSQGPLLEQTFAAPDRVHIRKFLQYLAETPPLGVQEAFCAAFDLNPDTCMNLTYHEYEDGANRGEALARFARAFDAAGFDPDCSDLPDYLPMVLELLSREENGAFQWVVFEHRQTIKVLEERLKSMKSPYAGIFQVLCGLFYAAANQYKKGA